MAMTTDPSLMQWLLSPWVFGLLGLVIGSFLNVVIHRLPPMLEREWLGDVAGYLQDDAAMDRVLGCGAPRCAELAGQGRSLASESISSRQ